jgi:hypothetical protein
MKNAAADVDIEIILFILHARKYNAFTLEKVRKVARTPLRRSLVCPFIKRLQGLNQQAR